MPVVQRRIKLLGHIVDEGGVSVDQEKIDTIRTRRFRPTVLSSGRFWVSPPITAASSKGSRRLPVHSTRDLCHVEFEWTEAMSEAFGSLRDALCSASILAFPDMARPFIVATDASSYAVGAVLSQLDNDGREHPVQFASRCLSPAERNYSTFEREALAVVLAFKKFRPFLLSNKVTLHTDHQALQHTFQQQGPARQGRTLALLPSRLRLRGAVPPRQVEWERGLLLSPPL